jgi:type IV pilus assembly protein PilB
VILLSGPTGSGKSTLLYVALQELNREWRNIITLEDPVERLIPGVNQIEVCEGGSSWSELTARLLRQDPDAIMLGEIRDRETAHAALNAGISGCLVLSTVHAGNCLEIFSRLGQLGADAHLLAQALRLLVAQRLLARNCALCARPVPVTPALARLFGLTADTPLSASLGCTACEFSGISGRLGVFELLRITAGIRECLLDKAAGVNLTQLEHCARNEGYRPLAVSVREALLRQEISPKSALRSMGIAPEFAGYQ